MKFLGSRQVQFKTAQKGARRSRLVVSAGHSGAEDRSYVRVGVKGTLERLLLWDPWPLREICDGRRRVSIIGRDKPGWVVLSQHRQIGRSTCDGRLVSGLETKGIGVTVF